jgi:mannitol-1-phosphate 5-dehydrogenase
MTLRGPALPKPLAVHFGAGNIGRGFLGQLYFESGYRTVFVDVSDSLVQEVNARGRYPLRLVDQDTRTLWIEDVSALTAGDVDAIRGALVEAEIASCAVGVHHLRSLGPILQHAGADRAATGKRLNFLVCENLVNAAALLGEAVGAGTENAYAFVDVSIGRMVPLMTADLRAEDSLMVCAEPYKELPADADAFAEPVPKIVGLQPKRPFAAYSARKLYVHNAGHAAAAYLGHLRGAKTLWEALNEERITALVRAAMTESCQALTAAYGLDAVELTEHREDLLRRFANRALGDTVARVAADPIRKLGPNDRLIGAMALCKRTGQPYRSLAFATAAACRFRSDDESGRRVAALYTQSGVAGVLGATMAPHIDWDLMGAVQLADRQLDDALRS